MSKKELLLGNEAVARGLYEAGVRVVSSYPGTPSTEITENAAKYDEIYCEWAPNEKVAMEVASGASFGGAPLLLRYEARGSECGRRPSVHHELYWRQWWHGYWRGRRPGNALLPERAGFPPLCDGCQDSLCWSLPIPPNAGILPSWPMIFRNSLMRLLSCGSPPVSPIPAVWWSWASGKNGN